MAHEGLDFGRVLYAINEREKWHRRYRELRSGPRPRTQAEMLKKRDALRWVIEYIKYYDTLLYDMRKRLIPQTLSRMVFFYFE